ncbi:beta-lactamase regulating signal transducer with metallopeptidase domain [Roseimicrobium gellanilyticum]|uniref:Beta-lactamase regulating signal transducer with metallopeptidase domain n=1 Tax=Roseimicrobium gellanilyticum TaxID=748857 RepID=A0A366HWD3_9BACT|nr:M56 family metallopeptidase [Roseimicrobium gellanilyticum]RBP48220.1 beta-lactamase regulating signal transducer with metallopeptidase domain [Roseimicrobium gellanilyticum]
MNPSLIPVVDVIAKSVAVLLLAMGVLSLWRGASASQRSLVWLLCFGALMLLPITSLVQPWWKVPVTETATVVQLPATAIPVATAAEVTGTVAPLEVAREESILPQWTLLQVAAVVWVVGVALVLGWQFMGSIRLRLLSARTQRCDDARMRGLFGRVSEEVCLRRPVELHTSEQVSVPMTWGSLRPVVLLPEEALSWSEEEVLAAVRHEMGHIKHWDHPARLLMSVVCAVYWFNPLVWAAARRWRTAQEQASDDLVVAQEDHRAESYAMQLLNAARRTQSQGLLKLPVMTMAQPSTLELRLSAIMDARKNRASVSRAAVCLGGIGALALLALCAGLQLHAAEPEKTKQPISITCRIYESSSNAGKQKIAGLKIDNKKPPQFAPAESEAFIKELTALDGVTLLSAPQVITSSGTNAVIKLETNNIYAADKTGAKSGTFTSGVWMDLLPTVSGGNITLEITPTIKDFEGVEMKDGVNQPVVKERKIDAKVTLKPGETAALDGGITKIGGAQRHLILLVSASLDTSTRTGTFSAHGTGRVQMATEKDPSFVPSKVPPKPALLQHAEGIIIPSVEFKDATLKEAVEFFRVKGRAHDSSGKGVNITLSADAADSTVRLTLSLKDVPLSEALRYTAELSNMELTADEFTLFLKKKEVEVKSKQEPAAPAKSAVLERAQKIILPRVKFSYAQLSEAVEFLNTKGKEMDPEKQGVNILVVQEQAGLGKDGKTTLRTTFSYGAPSQEPKKAEPGKPGSTVILAPEGSGKNPQVTLDLVDVPLSEAVRYVADLAGLEVVAGQHALLLRPKAVEK